ncbi:MULTISPECIES: rhodanese-like domain-containing protein [Corynebacterium]|uniref:Sulfurtransferase n=2 Tax=Corynebacterium ammoniagenes TaxID=1697 RepID=A0AAV5G967_CORAM|nr:rhodanese-like domain-containing protein [Corynebacterium ammoniagenes]APT81445.1 sulfurtransferase [Corynebacterium ammoniagenes DSM 20306]AQS72575.1 sulfurtransferase [Corynebacterium ammoniagenes]EFG80902.1 rhodanese-like protein [Corynebacterium ammoniagenes DSM 20306]GJN43871.1 sulfurtransferase [Corynebacterium ammoniagenes]
MAEITVPDAQKRYTQDQILDVREGFEVAEGMIPGALHIPMGQLGSRLGDLDKDRPIIVVCRSGNRSAAVADALNQAGYTADTMAGGMTAWQRAGLPTR